MNLELAFLAPLTKTKMFKIYTNVCTAYMYIVQFVHTVHMYILVLKILRSLKKSVLRMCNFKPNSIVYIEESFASK